MHGNILLILFTSSTAWDRKLVPGGRPKKRSRSNREEEIDPLDPTGKAGGKWSDGLVQVCEQITSDARCPLGTGDVGCVALTFNRKHAYDYILLATLRGVFPAKQDRPIAKDQISSRLKTAINHPTIVPSLGKFLQYTSEMLLVKFRLEKNVRPQRPRGCLEIFMRKACGYSCRNEMLGHVLPCRLIRKERPPSSEFFEDIIFDLVHNTASSIHETSAFDISRRHSEICSIMLGRECLSQR